MITERLDKARIEKLSRRYAIYANYVIQRTEPRLNSLCSAKSNLGDFHLKKNVTLAELRERDPRKSLRFFHCGKNDWSSACSLNNTVASGSKLTDSQAYRRRLSSETSNVYIETAIALVR